jgi:hypothetical protein
VDLGLSSGLCGSVNFGQSKRWVWAQDKSPNSPLEAIQHRLSAQCCVGKFGANEVLWAEVLGADQTQR